MKWWLIPEATDRETVPLIEVVPDCTASAGIQRAGPGFAGTALSRTPPDIVVANEVGRTTVAPKAGRKT